MPIDGKELRAIVQHYENLEDDRKQAQKDQAQLLKDAEEKGFDKKAVLIRYLSRHRSRLRPRSLFGGYNDHD